MTIAAIEHNGQPSAALAIRPGQEMFSDKQKAALSALGIQGASNADLAVFMHYCQKTGLDPFSRQIYLIKRRENQGGQWVDKQTIQVGIDGFRVIRDRIARREGIAVEYEDTIWYDASGGEHGVWLWDDAPAACRVVVVKNGQRFPGVVRTAAYAATKDGKLIAQWRTQPDHMIEKCAEAFALRRAFPHDLGGIYIDEEIPAMPASVPQRPQRVTRAEIVGESQPAEPGNPPRQPQQDRPAVKGTPSKSKLDKLLGQLPLGPEEDVRVLLEWLCGGEYTASRPQVSLVTSWLEDHLQAVQGDTAEAASAIWAQYRAATAQQAAEGSQEDQGGGDG